MHSRGIFVSLASRHSRCVGTDYGWSVLWCSQSVAGALPDCILILYYKSELFKFLMFNFLIWYSQAVAGALLDYISIIYYKNC